MQTRDDKTGFFGKPVFRLLKTGFKPDFGFNNLHKKYILYKANNFMYRPNAL